MTEVPLNHPGDEALLALSLGQLTEAELSHVCAHLGDCPACCRRIDQLAADDRLLARLGQLSEEGQGEGRRGTVVSQAQRSPAVRALRQSRKARSGTLGIPSTDHLEVAAVSNASTAQTYRDPSPCRGLPDGELTRFLAPPQAPDEIGRLGPYRILAVLGRGGMGVVFRAHDSSLDRLIALKAMLPGMAAAPTARERFLREARAAAALKHPHVVTIFQVGEDRGAPFLAMEFLEGETLDERIGREGRLPLPEVLRIGYETALALAAAHARGLVHRDIKPANLWLEGPTGHVKVLDFGLARATADQAQLTQSGLIVGTPAYMAPEQAEGKPVTPRCDLFSLGCVLYQMSTGTQPFRGETTIAILRALALHEPSPLRELRPESPQELSDLVVRLLSKEPENRPASAQEVSKTLAALEQSPTSPTLPRPGAKPGRQSRKPLAAVAGAALALILVLWPTPRGTVRIESDDPAVEVVFDEDGPTLQVLRDGEVVATQALPLPAAILDEAWLKKVQALTPQEQDREVAARLKNLNPGFDGRLVRRIESVGVRIELVTDHVTNLTPLRALTGVSVLSCYGTGRGAGHVADAETIQRMRLTGLCCLYTNVADLALVAGMKLIYLDCSGTTVTDLEPLRGMPMMYLYVQDCPGIKSLAPLEGMPLKHAHFAATGIADLAPLQGMQLAELHCENTMVTDLSVLRGMPLKILSCDFQAERDAAILRSIKTLTEINGKPPAAFWKEVDGK